MQRPFADQYFHRTEEWDWLNKDMIHVIDSRAPRMITMDPWPQRIYLDATGQQTVEQYIRSMRSRYLPSLAPAELETTILNELRHLVEVEGLVRLSDVPVRLEPNVLYARTPDGLVRLAGAWEGSYAYADGRSSVGFRIVVRTVNGARFTGEVKDDEQQGGTPGTGSIKGTWDQKKVAFVKRMPVYSGYDAHGQKVVDPQRRHPPIYYLGEFSASKAQISGTWRFKDRIIWKGLVPYRVRQGSGTWTMKWVG